jgi:hypothetical protein
MPFYRFRLRDGADLLEDECGTWLPNLPAASEHACAVARELMEHRERESRHCKIKIYAENRGPLLVIPFAAVDPTLDHLGLRDRQLIERTSTLIGTLKATLVECTMTYLYSRALSARMRRRPYVVADRGRRVL